MKIGHSVAKSVWVRSTIASLALGLLLLPASRSARATHLHEFAAPQSAQSQSDADEARRDREEAQREREQEKREREQERLERLQELYDDGREALDDDQYEKAEHKFAELASLNGPQTDAALYWQAYAENKLGKKAAALSHISDLKSKYGQSKWKKDAEALEIEVRQGTGQAVKPKEGDDSDLYNLALQGVMNNSPDRAIPLIEKKLNGPASVKDKGKLLFILAQSGQPSAMQVLARIAEGKNNPDLQRKAIEYLSMFGSGAVIGGVDGGVEGGVKGGVSGSYTTKDLLAQIYKNTSDESVKAAIIRSHLLNGDRASLLAEAKTEKSENLRREAIRTLGLTGGTSELEQLYQSETSLDVKREILQAFFLSGDSKRMEQAATGEKDLELRRAAIRNLGLMGHSDVLQSLYAKETDYNLKEECLNGLFLSGNAKGLVAIAKSEKDASLKRKAVEKLSLMNSKEGNEYMMELLNK
jgi:hypothetical protein